MTQTTQQITLAGGCFWCIEGAFQYVNGIVSAQSGYMGGTIDNPRYEQITSGKSGHAEVVQLTFEPTQISIRDILEIFFSLHNPTELNRQGYDVGTQYRSAIFYHNQEQKQQALTIIDEIDEDQIWPIPVVTEVVEQSTFYLAESYHQHYFENNSTNQYCQIVISPKLAKLKQKFADKLKET